MRPSRTSRNSSTRIPLQFPKEFVSPFEKILQLAALLADELEIIEVSLASLFLKNGLEQGRSINLQEEVGRFETLLIQSMLAKTAGNQSRAARQLGLRPSTLNAKIKRYGIAIDRHQTDD